MQMFLQHACYCKDTLYYDCLVLNSERVRQRTIIGYLSDWHLKSSYIFFLISRGYVIAINAKMKPLIVTRQYDEQTMALPVAGIKWPYYVDSVLLYTWPLYLVNGRWTMNAWQPTSQNNNDHETMFDTSYKTKGNNSWYRSVTRSQPAFVSL